MSPEQLRTRLTGVIPGKKKKKNDSFPQLVFAQVCFREWHLNHHTFSFFFLTWSIYTLYLSAFYIWIRNTDFSLVSKNITQVYKLQNIKAFFPPLVMIKVIHLCFDCSCFVSYTSTPVHSFHSCSTESIYQACFRISHHL